jgi:hypothetical protein
LPEAEAYELEGGMIQKIGTIADGTGPLVNEVMDFVGQPM